MKKCTDTLTTVILATLVLWLSAGDVAAQMVLGLLNDGLDKRQAGAWRAAVLTNGYQRLEARGVLAENLFFKSSPRLATILIKISARRLAGGLFLAVEVIDGRTGVTRLVETHASVGDAAGRTSNWMAECLANVERRFTHETGQQYQRTVGVRIQCDDPFSSEDRLRLLFDLKKSVVASPGMDLVDRTVVSEMNDMQAFIRDQGISSERVAGLVRAADLSCRVTGIEKRSIALHFKSLHLGRSLGFLSISHSEQIRQVVEQMLQIGQRAQREETQVEVVK